MDAVQRRKVHRGRNALAVQHPAQAGAMTQMSHDYAAGGALTRLVRQDAGDVFVREPVGTVANHSSVDELTRKGEICASRGMVR